MDRESRMRMMALTLISLGVMALLFANTPRVTHAQEPDVGVLVMPPADELPGATWMELVLIKDEAASVDQRLTAIELHLAVIEAAAQRRIEQADQVIELLKETNRLLNLQVYVAVQLHGSTAPPAEEVTAP